jgi:hypothetical protein
MGDFMKRAIGSALIAALVLTPLAAHAQPTDLKVRKGRHGETIVIPPSTKPPLESYRLENADGGSITVGRMTAGKIAPLVPPSPFRIENGTVFHPPTGARLPLTHGDCRLGAIAPLADEEANSFARGAVAEYDCRPSTGLTYVLVAFEGGSPYLGSDLVGGLDQIAYRTTATDSHTPTTCSHMSYPEDAPFTRAGLTVTQCGVGWRKTKDPNGPVYRSATFAFGKGSTYFRLTRTCFDKQCDTATPAFGKFVDTFDLSELRAELAKP